MKNELHVNDLKVFSVIKLERMKEALLIAIEQPCSNKRFLDYCNRLDCIYAELNTRKL